MYPNSPNKAKEIGFKHYFTGKRCLRNHIDLRYTASKECVSCRREKNRNPLLLEKQKQWAIDNKEHISKLAKKRYYLDVNKERARSRKRWLLYPEKVKATNLNWAKNNPNKVKALMKTRNARRRLVVKQQCPKWADKEKIKEIYMNRPEGYHVDHIIPLRGKLVSGLHTQDNLQYLTISENSRKNNKFIGV